jgi:hypothetical protein
MIYYYPKHDRDIDGMIWRLISPNPVLFKKGKVVSIASYEEWFSQFSDNDIINKQITAWVSDRLFTVLSLKYEVMVLNI